MAVSGPDAEVPCTRDDESITATMNKECPHEM